MQPGRGPHFEKQGSESLSKMSVLFSQESAERHPPVWHGRGALGDSVWGPSPVAQGLEASAGGGCVPT